MRGLFSMVLLATVLEYLNTGMCLQLSSMSSTLHKGDLKIWSLSLEWPTFNFLKVINVDIYYRLQWKQLMFTPSEKIRPCRPESAGELWPGSSHNSGGVWFYTCGFLQCCTAFSVILIFLIFRYKVFPVICVASFSFGLWRVWLCIFYHQPFARNGRQELNSNFRLFFSWPSWFLLLFLCSRLCRLSTVFTLVCWCLSWME